MRNFEELVCVAPSCGPDAIGLGCGLDIRIFKSPSGDSEWFSLNVTDLSDVKKIVQKGKRNKQGMDEDISIVGTFG